MRADFMCDNEPVATDGPLDRRPEAETRAIRMTFGGRTVNGLVALLRILHE